jgi:hypothetical protein
MKNTFSICRNLSALMCLTIAVLSTKTVFSQSMDNAVNSVNLALTTNPLLIAQASKPNLQATISWRSIGFGINGSYKATTETTSGLTKQHTEYAIVPSLKIFPLSAAFNCLHRSAFRKNSQTSCFSFEEPREYVNRPNGPYLSAGYSFEKLHYSYPPDTSVHRSISNSPFSIKNNGVQLEAGYQVTTKWISIGLGYHLNISVPQIEGSFNPFGNALYTSTYPVKYRLQQGFHLQIGFNLSF